MATANKKSVTGATATNREGKKKQDDFSPLGENRQDNLSSLHFTSPTPQLRPCSLASSSFHSVSTPCPAGFDLLTILGPEPLSGPQESGSTQTKTQLPWPASCLSSAANTRQKSSKIVPAHQDNGSKQRALAGAVVADTEGKEQSRRSLTRSPDMSSPVLPPHTLPPPRLFPKHSPYCAKRKCWLT